ncbi:hypothetical protein IT411_03950, partial [Candidatus Peregrinibacteria bacterium]|nr:hypothetical protein [Candidatus Peregrinibacteria bacterium]
MSNLLKQIPKFTFYTILATGLAFFLRDFSLAQTLPLPDVGNYNGMVQDPGGKITDFGTGAASLIVGIVMNIRYVLTAVAIAMIIFAGFRMVTAQGNEEAWKSAKSTLVWSIVGLALVGLSGEIVRIFAVGKCTELGMLPATNTTGCVEGGFLKNPQAIVQRATIFNTDVKYIITFIKYVIGALAVTMLMRNAIRMVTNSAGDELEKDKKNVVASIIGLILIIVADPIINKVFFSIDTTRYPGTGGPEVAINYVQGVSEIVGFTNFLVTILTPIAILVIVAGGVMYMTAAGNPDAQGKAQRMIFLALVAILLIYG